MRPVRPGAGPVTAAVNGQRSVPASVRSCWISTLPHAARGGDDVRSGRQPTPAVAPRIGPLAPAGSHGGPRSEEHTSELQSQSNLVCRLLLEKKKNKKKKAPKYKQTKNSKEKK